ncbi:fasciclin domain-containing protein [Salinisphaera sp. LB1]|uniref:fasciclin domain-containing protein n=1 Tax=Salinisphaera sp. LB1 TaxID=2183911 RepID=UPI000D706ED9|nr:fasciclin domain-containing protein [Salinisphaera sp. LB1]AWN16237.1 Secreted and surface protein containing fasciclin-like repeats [Salinisphaera sp. LB1]
MNTIARRIGTAVVSTLLGCSIFAFGAGVATASGMQNQAPMVGGAPMYASKTIVQNASQAATLTTLVAAVKAAGLAGTLSGPGPFTVFAPTNSAFDALPDGTVATLLKPANKAQLQKILTYHVISGDYDSTSLMHMIAANGDQAMLEMKTVEGEPLTFSMQNGNLTVTDAQGNTATVTQADVTQSNGVVHVINKVLMP